MRGFSVSDAVFFTFRAWRDFREHIARNELAMRIVSQNATSLRAEARLLTAAGLILLAIGFPLTITLAVMALSPHGLSPILPPAIGGPFLILGYVACHYASERLAKAKRIEEGACTAPASHAKALDMALRSLRAFERQQG